MDLQVLKTTYKYSIVFCVGSTEKSSFIKLEPCFAKQSPAGFFFFFFSCTCCVHCVWSRTRFARPTVWVINNIPAVERKQARLSRVHVAQQCVPSSAPRRTPAALLWLPPHLYGIGPPLCCAVDDWRAHLHRGEIWKDFAVLPRHGAQSSARFLIEGGGEMKNFVIKK